MIGLISLTVSLVYHSQLRLFGVVAIETATGALNNEIAGELEIGELREVNFEQVVAESVIVRDPQGREVIRIARLTAWPDLDALWSGTIRVDRAHARGAEVTLYVSGEENNHISLADSFLPARPPQGPRRQPPLVIVDQIVVDDVLLRGDVPGYSGLRVEDIRLEGRVTAQNDVRFDVWDGRGTMTGPYAGRTQIERITGHYSTDLRGDGLDAYARARRGDDRVRARIQLHAVDPDPAAPPVMDLLVAAEPVRISTLAEMEVAPGLDGLEATMRGHARLYGPTNDLRLRADIGTEAGRVQVRGHLPSGGPLVLEGDTDRLALARLVPRAPATTLAGRARITLSPEHDGSGELRQLRAELSPATVNNIAVPGFTMDAVLEDDAIVVTDLDATHAGGETLARGRIGFDGSMDVHVSTELPNIGADPNVRRVAPDARGSLSGEVDLRADAGGENLAVDARLAMRGVRYGAVRADRLTVRGRASGSLPAPTLRAQAEAHGLHVGALALGHANASVAGGPNGYEVSAHSEDEEAGTQFAIVGRASSSADGLRLRSSELLVDVGDGQWQGNVDMHFAPGESVRLDPLVLAHGRERVVVSGTYRFDGEDDLDVDVMNLELAHLRPIAPEQLEGVAGVVDAHVDLHGDLDTRPQGRVRARVREGQYRGISGIEGRADLDLTGDRMNTDIALDMGEAGAVYAQGPLRVPPSALRDPRRLAEEVGFEGLRVRAENLDVAPLVAMAGLADDVQISGRITTEAELTGTTDEPGLRDVVLVLDQIVLPGWDPLRGKLHASMGDGRLDVRRAWIADAGGELLTAEGELPLPLDSMPRDLPGFYRLLRSEQWRLSAFVANRRLDGWPNPIQRWMPPGLTAAGTLTAQGENGELTADLAIAGRWAEAAVEDRCAANLRPEVSVVGRLEGELATATITGFFGAPQAELTIETAAALPVEEWLVQGVSEFPSTEILARARGLDLANVPWLCGYGRGTMDGSLTAKNLLTEDAVVGAVVDIPRLQIWEDFGTSEDSRLSSEYRVSIRTGSSPERDALTACVIMGMAGDTGTPGAQCREASEPADGEMLGRVRVPVRWHAGELLPEYVQGGAINSWMRFAHVHVEPVLTLIPGIVTGDAVMNGEVRANGPWESIQLAGGLELERGHVQVEGLGQHLSDIQGRVELRGNRAIFPPERPLSVRDAEGVVTVSGEVGFSGLMPQRLDLIARGNNFPVRNEGMVLAWLSGQAEVTGTISDEATESEVAASNFTVRLPEQSAASLQSLQQHGDILVVGEERPRTDSDAEDSYPIRVRITADGTCRDRTRRLGCSTAFWVRRNDFSAYVTADLRAEYRDPHLRVSGMANIHRGTFEIFGKRLELLPGTLTFDGREELNPRVNITAVYEIPGRTGATVNVTVSGTLTAPEVEFSSTETSDRAEIIALLVGGGRRDPGAAEREATQQAASFLAGLTAGILTLGLRQEFGNIIPVLAIESEGLSGTRIRAGFNADDLIPEFLDDVVTGMYIEGFLSAAADGTSGSSGAGGVGGGVTVEFTLPEGFVVRGTYVPVDNGSLDILFEP